MRVLVTRPEPEASMLAGRLVEAGHEALIAPLMTIVLSPEPKGLAGPGAIVVTSRNGVQALASWQAPRGWRAATVYSVGEATAAAARAAGFIDVRSADGDGHALAALISGDFDGSRGSLLYAAARDRSVELAALLPDHSVVTVEAYRADAARALPPTVAEAIAEGRVDAVVLYSRRTAGIFRDLVRSAGVIAGLARTRLYALSAQVAEPLQGLGGRVVVATHPDEASLLRLIDPALARRA